MAYTIGEMAKRLGLPASTLRYYDKEGLLPFVGRTDSGIRIFEDSDFEWLQIIECLKKTGMRLTDIRHFIEMAMQGDATIDERLKLIIQQKQRVLCQIEELTQTLQVLEFKQWYYETAREAGTTDLPNHLPDEQLPAPHRETRRKLRGGSE